MNGTPHLGCADGFFTFKTALSLRMNQNLPTFAGCDDLIEVYDTTDHKLPIKVLERYGAPSKFCSSVEHMYKDLTVVIKLEKSIVEISQGVGVRQGNNMAPVLFLFLVSVFAESLEVVWGKWP